MWGGEGGEDKIRWGPFSVQYPCPISCMLMYAHTYTHAHINTQTNTRAVSHQLGKH